MGAAFARATAHADTGADTGADAAGAWWPMPTAAARSEILRHEREQGCGPQHAKGAPVTGPIELQHTVLPAPPTGFVEQAVFAGTALAGCCRPSADALAKGWGGPVGGKGQEMAALRLVAAHTGTSDTS